MPTTITNQARLQFTYGQTTATASSNIASTVLQESLVAAKSVLENGYRADSDLTYIVNFTNSGATAMTNVTITDNLGTYAVSPTLSVTPLFYNDPAQLYINGVFSTTLSPVPAVNGITFTIPSIPANSNAMLIYKVIVNQYAPLATGASITNTATVTAAALTEPITVTSTIDVDGYADVSIMKTMTPNPVTDGSTLTYTFTIQNYGNTEATDVTLSDTFSPAPNPITVSVDGTTLSAADYSYASGVLTLPGAASAYSLTIPPATFLQDAVSGEVTINPGTVTIVVAGTL